MYSVIIIMLAGFFVGVLIREKKNILKKVDFGVTIAIYILLFLMGVSVGSNKLIINNLHNIAFKALIITLGAVLGSCLTALFIYRFFFKKDEK